MQEVFYKVRVVLRGKFNVLIHTQGRHWIEKEEKNAPQSFCL